MERASSLLGIAVFFKLCLLVKAACYFPSEFQGEYKMQNADYGRGLEYSTLNITANAIPVWGFCHRKTGNTFMLVISYAGENCIRCLHLKLRSKNVLQMYVSARETISKCYINERSAQINCPSEESLQNRSTTQMLLYKIKDAQGKPLSPEYCPIEGTFSLTYKVNDDTSSRECRHFESHLDSCPSGSTLNINLRGCTFGNYDLKLDCIGYWDGPAGETYLALRNEGTAEDSRLQYRCSVFKKDPHTGLINLSISRDSTCSDQLYNSTHGYESYVLMPLHEIEWPAEVISNQCTFPKWLIGNWEHTRVRNDTFIYKDHASFKTYIIKCVAFVDRDDTYLVYSTTRCGEKLYNCMRVERKGDDIMEFQLGTNSSANKNAYHLCSDTNLQQNAWITQARREKKSSQMAFACPISGEYAGVIPDTADLCATLWSDCEIPNSMFYRVSDCAGSQVYEEREYTCLGHWKEGRFLYTYTRRRDIAAPTFECFVGTVILDKQDIYIQEAGEHCRRGINPLRQGMKLNKLRFDSCPAGPDTNKQSKQPSKSAPTQLRDIKMTLPTILRDVDNSISDTAPSTSSTLLFVLACCTFSIHLLR